MRIGYGFLVSIIGVFGATPALAQCEFGQVESSDGALQRITVLREAGCFGGERDDSALTKQIRELLSELDEDPGTRRRLAVTRDALIGALRQLDQSNVDSLATGSAAWRAASIEFSRQIGIVIVALQQMDLVVPAARWEAGDDHNFFQTVSLDYLIEYGQLVRADCSDPQSDSCQRSMQQAAVINRLMTLGHSVLKFPVRERIAKMNDDLTRRDSEWDYYFDEARSQYFWELGFNNLIYDPPGNKLVGPPKSQLILLHPTVALEYVGSGPENESAYDAVGLVEVIGYNQWKTSVPIGFSVVTTYTPETTGDRVGIGAFLHINHNYSIGATRRDTGLGDETTWLFSVDLTKLFLTKSAEVRERFRFGDGE